MDLERPLPPNPYDFLPAFDGLKLWSEDLIDGQTLPHIHTAAAESISPHLSWSRGPASTASYLVTCFDPDAPSPSGYWHWSVLDIPSSTTSLERGSGESDLTLPAAMFHLASDGGAYGYEGAAPPVGDRPHRYIFAVHALSVDTLDLEPEDSPTKASLKALPHTLARGTLTVTYQLPATKLSLRR